ncbi:undecaprenyl-diphosphate phosphatase [Micromonospora sp. HM5-17]|uniref:undecaprenyl-diphosphate phosphatase n=1 Tax=Micromonospora sp. HM5-17 TaxID=2487710 RepID=UPI000F4ACE9C|nr:undecaprenyl-diphosphate phosphatase [Micromonospora sp. HM5-17]ROT34264.1 undecaprenyl-diphosphate phosphatase [Micromonospora sp. HM5-17]
MNIVQAVILGVVEGLTEFLPVSSTGHLTITEKLLGLRVDDAGVTAFTAIIQVGAIAAVFVYFHSDIARLVTGWCRGLGTPAARSKQEWRFGWYIIAGSIPIGVVGLAGKHLVEAARSLWFVAAALIGWSAVMAFAEHRATHRRGEADMRLPDVLWIGIAQCAALIPGVSRSGATISAGLMRDLDRVTATRLSFFLAIPAMTAAGGFEAIDAASAISHSVGWTATTIATTVAFATAYASIAWLLKFVTHHKISVFIWYRIGAGVLLTAALTSGLISAT